MAAAQLAAAAAAALLLTTACSSGSSEPSTSPSESPAATATTAVLPPIEITKAADVTVDIGSTLVVNTEGVTRVSTDNPAVLEISQPRDDGSAQFNAGATVVGAGSATLDVYGQGDAKLYDVKVTGLEPGPDSVDPSAGLTE